MASIVERGGQVWQVNVRYKDPDGFERTRWHTLPETVHNQKQARAEVSRLQPDFAAKGETGALSTIRQHANTSYFVKWDVIIDGRKKQRWRKLPGIVHREEAIARKLEIEKMLAAGLDPFPVAEVAESMGTLLLKWAGSGEPKKDDDGHPIKDKSGQPVFDLGSLTNRNGKSDRAIVKRHLIPRFGEITPAQVDTFAVVRWLDDLAKGKLSTQTQRHLLSVLSRFFGWLAERVPGTDNPVRKISKKARPVVVHKRRAWLENEAMVPKLMAALEKRQPQIALMFALGNRSGLRLGEIAGLRMTDVAHLGRGYITASHSYAGPLKEDRGRDGVQRTKTIPAPVNAAKILGPHLRSRKSEGAGSNDPVFLAPLPKWTRTMRRREWPGYTKEAVNYHWRRACAEVGLVDGNGKPTVTFYGATRHSAASRAKKAGLPPELIAESLGHRDVSMVKRFYFGSGTDRTEFDPALRLAIPTPNRTTSDSASLVKVERPARRRRRDTTIRRSPG